jgi:hypothetical protein
LSGVSGIKFDISRVFAGIVGKSEERCRSALATIDAMAPCVVLMDEIDKGMGGVVNGGRRQRCIHEGARYGADLDAGSQRAASASALPPIGKLSARHTICGCGETQCLERSS